MSRETRFEKCLFFVMETKNKTPPACFLAKFSLLIAMNKMNKSSTADWIEINYTKMRWFINVNISTFPSKVRLGTSQSPNLTAWALPVSVVVAPTGFAVPLPGEDFHRICGDLGCTGWSSGKVMGLK